MSKTNCSSDDLKWLYSHRKKVEKYSDDLEVFQIITFLMFGVIIGTASIYLVTIHTINSNYLFFILLAILLVGLIFAGIYGRDSLGLIFLIAIAIGYFIGVLLGAPMLPNFLNSTAIQQNISMTVFYPNHPNITVTQTCTPINTSALGYFNGKAINPKSTTKCDLPANIAPPNSNPFNCSIINENITCVSDGFNDNITWEGKVLNVS